MKIDMAALRSLEREKDISFDKVCQAIETALLTAYRHTEGAQAHARVDLDRSSGDVRVLAQELGEDGAVAREWDDTPEGFGRIATSTARQVILQRLREAESELSYDAYAGREGDVVSGLVQQAGQRPGAPPNRNVMVKLGTTEDALEAVLPPAEQVPGEVYEHGTRLKCRVISVARGPRGASVTVSRTHPDLVRGLFAQEVPEVADGSVEIVALAREAGHRTKIAVRSTVPGLGAKGACIGPVGSRVRAVTAELHGEKIDIVDWSPDPARFVAYGAVAGAGDQRGGRRPGAALGARRRPRLPAVARHRQGGAERPARRAAHRLADRHPQRRGRAGGRRARRRGPVVGGAREPGSVSG